MATKLIQAPMPNSHVFPPTPTPGTTKMMRTQTSLSATQPKSKKGSRFADHPSSSGLRSIKSFIKAAEQTSGLQVEIDESEDFGVENTKAALYDALQGINRGIFGVPSEKKSEIEALVKLLESKNPTPEPTQSLERVAGSWTLVYSTITILGSKRTKLGLRDFITLGDFLQIIDVAEGKAVNVIKFSARGLNLLNGQLTIEASFKIASESRVDISYSNSSITPEQLMNMFSKNYDLLLGIFNPEGWLEITYVDDMLRIGRDDKGNIFILERSTDKSS